MLFESEIFYIDLVEEKDLKAIVDVYNSNKVFLINHMDTDKVTSEWLIEELNIMKESGFCTCKIVKKGTGEIIGLIDFKIDDETYLSLLMLHSRYKNKRFGQLVYMGLEEYAKSLGSICIRIDVVTGYDERVLDFWSKNGFDIVNNIELNWTGKILPAVVMKKSI